MTKLTELEKILSSLAEGQTPEEAGIPLENLDAANPFEHPPLVVQLDNQIQEIEEQLEHLRRLAGNVTASKVLALVPLRRDEEEDPENTALASLLGKTRSGAKVRRVMLHQLGTEPAPGPRQRKRQLLDKKEGPPTVVMRFATDRKYLGAGQTGDRLWEKVKTKPLGLTRDWIAKYAPSQATAVRDGWV